MSAVVDYRPCNYLFEPWQPGSDSDFRVALVPLLRQCEGNHRIATRETEQIVSAGGNRHVLRTVDLIGNRRGVDTGAAQERPQMLAGRRVEALLSY